MHTGVVKLYALADPIGAAAEYHDLLVGADRHSVLFGAVGGIIIRRILNAAYRHGFKYNFLAERKPPVPYLLFLYFYFAYTLLLLSANILFS